MSLADELASRSAESVRKDRPAHPQGWEPGVSWSGQHGTITSRPLAEPTPNWDELIRVWGFDPAVVEIVEPVQVRTWDAAIGDGNVRTMWYYRAGIRQRRAGGPDLDGLIAELARKRPPKPRAEPRGEAHFGVVLADWQLGREGTAATVERWGDGLDSVRRRYRELRKIGRPIGQLDLLGVGDLVEGCKGWYANQTYTVELNKREQVRLGRRMVLRALTEWTPDFDRYLVAGVGGNHGEARDESGQAFTDFGDNADVEILEQAGEVAMATPSLKHGSFLIPNDHLTLTIDICGQIVGLAHGHTAKVPGATPQAKMRKWLEGQMYGRQPVGDSDIIINGHWHHWSWIRDGREHLQAPPLASGARWFTESKGTDEIPGILTFVIDANGVSDVQVL